MANGYIVGIVALFILYSLVHHKKTAFYEVNNETTNSDTCDRSGMGRFIPYDEQNELFQCFYNTEIKCNKEDKYRQITGYCNNLNNPLWGGSHTAYLRVVHAYYDGFYGLRKGTNGRELPWPRTLSTEVLSTKKKLSKNKTMFLTTFGQIIAHDIGEAIPKQGSDCCEEIEKGTEEFIDYCCELNIPKDDPYFSKHNKTCIDLQRHSSTSTNTNCTTLKQPYPLTRVSSYLDLSFLYGYDEEIAATVREYSGGRLLISKYTDDGPTLPLVEGGCPAEPRFDAQPVCFAAGDSRINQNPEVVIYTTIFLRSHNYIAVELEKLHPDWNDTKLFEEARRINIAAYQRVTYNEFLPALIGKENCEKRGLLEKKDGYSDQYDPKVNAQSMVSFIAGVYRALHTLQPGNVTMRDSRFKQSGYYLSENHFNEQAFLVTESHTFTRIVNGFSRNEAIEKQGEYAAFDFWDKAFKNEELNLSTDVFAIDISRGRDNGVPPYNVMRKYCGLCPLKSFDQLGDGTRVNVVKKLETLYDNIEDLDLLIGVFLEAPLPNSIYGPTGQCLIEEAFYRYKMGDRFFYEFNNEYVSFTEDQLDVIKQVTFSNFVCLFQNNSELVIQENSFYQPSPTNPVKQCSDISFLNLTLF